MAFKFLFSRLTVKILLITFLGSPPHHSNIKITDSVVISHHLSAYRLKPYSNLNNDVVSRMILSLSREPVGNRTIHNIVMYLYIRHSFRFVVVLSRSLFEFCVRNEFTDHWCMCKFRFDHDEKIILCTPAQRLAKV